MHRSKMKDRLAAVFRIANLAPLFFSPAEPTDRREGRHCGKFLAEIKFSNAAGNFSK
jgi:hypothetical protein